MLTKVRAKLIGYYAEGVCRNPIATSAKLAIFPANNV